MCSFFPLASAAAAFFTWMLNFTCQCKNEATKKKDEEERKEGTKRGKSTKKITERESEIIKERSLTLRDPVGHHRPTGKRSMTASINKQREFLPEKPTVVPLKENTGSTDYSCSLRHDKNSSFVTNIYFHAKFDHFLSAGRVLGSLRFQMKVNQRTKRQLVSWCFKPSQPQRIAAGLLETFIKKYIC